jgi:integrase
MQLTDHVRWLRDERGNATSSLRRKIATLKGFFGHAVTCGWIVSSPAASLAYPPPRRAPIICLDAAEAELVLAQAAHDPAWHALVLLLLDCGLKRDEVLALRAHDLALSRDAGEGHVTIRRTADSKRLRYRNVPLTARTCNALLRLLSVPLPGGRLFSLSVRGVNFVVETVGRKAEFARARKLTPEILRDTFAVGEMLRWMSVEREMATRGTPPDELARLQREHDREVLQVLGLSRYSDAAPRYRAAAAALPACAI